LAQPPDFQGIGLDDGLSMGSDDVLNAWQLFQSDNGVQVRQRSRPAGESLEYISGSIFFSF
jgi:hypothetical protein